MKIVLPKQIELGSYSQGNKRKIAFSPKNKKHINMFKKFFGNQLPKNLELTN